jgi:hypothetical protein
MMRPVALERITCGARRTTRVVLLTALLATMSHTVGHASEGGSAELLSLLHRADQLFDLRWREDAMESAIAAYEETLPVLPELPVQSQAFVLNRLAELCYESTTFDTGFRGANRSRVETGKEYGFRSLRLNPEFARLESTDFEAAISAVSDAAALLWTGDNWAVLCGLDPIAGVLHIGKVKALFQRCLAVDETYWGASPHTALGALLVATPTAFGGDPEAGRAHLRRATELVPCFLYNHVVYAQYAGLEYDALGRRNGIRDASLIRERATLVLATPIQGWPFWNREAKREAEALLSWLDSECG